LLVTERNDHAMKVLERTLQSGDNNDKSNSNQSVALLYGCSHCPDLHRRLVSMGFRPTSSTWRTAWSVRGANHGTATSPAGGTAVPAVATTTTTVAAVVLVVLYLTVGALDWVGTSAVVSTRSLSDGDYAGAGLDAASYLVRHVLLYLGLSKFLVDWTGTGTR
jgi:hypothetical protein